MRGFEVERDSYGDWYAMIQLDAHECEGIADALGLHDSGAQELLDAAEAIRAMEARDSGVS